MNRRGRSAREHRDLIQKLSRYSIGLAVAAVLVAVAGAALVALLLRGVGLPFVPTWLLLSLLVIVIAVAGSLIQSRRNT